MRSDLTIIRYNKQLTKSIYILSVFTPNDFGFLIGALAIYILMFNSTLGLIIILGCYPIYLLIFRLGKPAGYDRHFLKSFFYPNEIRPGRVIRKAKLL